jgi:hypothetical protein
MDEHQWLVEQFEAERPHLQAVAYRMLGSLRFWATDEPAAARVESHVESRTDQVLRDEALARVSAKLCRAQCLAWLSASRRREPSGHPSQPERGCFRPQLAQRVYLPLVGSVFKEEA